MMPFIKEEQVGNFFQVKSKCTFKKDTPRQYWAYPGNHANLETAKDALTEKLVRTTGWQEINVWKPSLNSTEASPELSLLLKANLIPDGGNIANQPEGIKDLSSGQVRANLSHENNEVHNTSTQQYPLTALVAVQRQTEVLKPAESSFGTKCIKTIDVSLGPNLNTWEILIGMERHYIKPVEKRYSDLIEKSTTISKSL